MRFKECSEINVGFSRFMILYIWICYELRDKNCVVVGFIYILVWNKRLIGLVWICFLICLVSKCKCWNYRFLVYVFIGVIKVDCVVF